MRNFVLLWMAGLLLLGAGCTSITRLNGDSFEASAAGYELFTIHDSACAWHAEEKTSGDARLIDSTRYARNRAYNGAYAACMRGHGYRPRPYVKNLLP